MFLCTTLLTLTGCATTSSLDWLRDEHASVITEDLAIAVTERWPPSEAALYVGEMPLRDHFEPAIRGHGYAVTSDPDDAITITGLTEKIPPNTWHIGLTVDDDIQIHRLYRIDHDDVRAVSSVSIGDLPSVDVENEIAISPQWSLRTRRLPSLAKAPEPDTATRSTCLSPDGASVSLSPGSLQRAVEQALNRCGWSLARWPNDPDHPGHVLDWVIDKPLVFDAVNLGGFLRQLEQSYGVVTERDYTHKVVIVSLAK